MTAAPEVVHVPERRRYELREHGVVVGTAHYRRRPGQVVFTHTVIADGHEGRGLGARLAHDALSDVRDAGLRIVPVCPFVAAYLRRHHEFDDVVDQPPAPGAPQPADG